MQLFVWLQGEPDQEVFQLKQLLFSCLNSPLHHPTPQILALAKERGQQRCRNTKGTYDGVSTSTAKYPIMTWEIPISD